MTISMRSQISTVLIALTSSSAFASISNEPLVQAPGTATAYTLEGDAAMIELDIQGAAAQKLFENINTKHVWNTGNADGTMITVRYGANLDCMKIVNPGSRSPKIEYKCEIAVIPGSGAISPPAAG